MAASGAVMRELRSVFGLPEAKAHLFRFLLPDPAPALVTPRSNVVVCAGRLQPSKGQDVLIRALPLIRKARPDAVVEILGAGPMRREYESLAASLGVGDACRFLGALPQPEASERMASAALVEKIILLLNDSLLRLRLGEVSRARFDAHFSMSNLPKHADFFEELIALRRS